LSQDFVRQLQLAKQLEQKAKEAAKGREAAETKIQEATGLLAKVKEMSAASVETEKMLTLATQSYSDKDYKEALSYAVRSAEASVRARKERLQEILKEARTLLDKVSSLGKEEEDTIKALKSASNAIEAGDMDDALELCREAWDVAERNANRVLSDAFGRAQSALLFAEKLELKVDKQKTALRNCRDALEAGDAGKSAELIQTLLGSLRSLAFDRFVQRSGRLEGLLALQKRLPMELEETNKALTEGRDLMTASRVEDAFDRLEDGEQSFSRAFSASVGSRLRELQVRAEEMNALHRKTELGDLEGTVRRLELEEKYSEAITALEEGRNKVRAVEREVLLKHMAEMQPRLRLAHMVKRDVAPALEKMEGARNALRDDDFKTAFSLVSEAAEIVEEQLVGYDRVEEELNITAELRSRCEDLRLPCAEGVKVMGTAKRLTLQGNFVEATDVLRQSQRAFKMALENYFAMAIMRLEMRMASAIRLGADVSAESSSLETLTAKVRGGDFELVQGSLVTIAESVEEKAAATVEREIGKAESVLSRYEGGPEVEKAKASLAEAKERLQNREFQAAHELTVELISDLMADRRKNLDLSMEEARSYMEMTRQLGVESVTLRDRIQRADELRTLGRQDEASLLADEVASYARSIVAGELEHQCTDLMRAVAEARKEGVEIGEPEHLCEQGSNALHRGDIKEAFEHTFAARRSLDDVTATHRKLKDHLEDGERIVAEAGKAQADVAEASEAVVRARTLFSAGRYKETAAELDKAKAHMRAKAPAFVLDSWYRRTAEVGKLRERLGFKGSEERLKTVGPLDAENINRQLSSLNEIRQEWEEEIYTALQKEMAACQMEVDRAASSGQAVGHVQQILVRGRGSLERRNLADAMSAVEVARKEMEQSLQEDRRLNDLLAQLDEALEQLREMKAESKDAVVLLEQARALRRTGNPSGALDTATRAMERSQTIAREKISSLMNFAGGLTPEREGWEDLRAARKLNDDIEIALKNRRYRHAHLLARSFREELERVLQDRSLAEEELRKFESRLNEEAKAGLRPPSSKKALERGRALMAQGRFVQALSAVSAARDELRVASEMYESRLADYNELRETLNSLELLDPRKDHVEELLDQCWSSLRDMKFDSASLYLRRARNGLNEFLTVRTNELLWEFNPLHDLIKRLKMRQKFSAEIEDIERTEVENISPRDLNRLSRSVELVRAGMRDVFQEQREKTRRAIEKASRADKQTGRSWEIWADAEGQAARGDLWEAFNLLETSINVIGRPAGETPELLSKQISEMLERANSMRIDLQGTERAYAEALHVQREGKNPTELLKKACEISRKEVRSTYPDISAELEFSGEVAEGRPLDVVVHLKNEAEHGARNVRAFIFGDAEVKGMVEAESLKGGEETKGRITVIPNRPGILSLGISVKCKPMLTDEDVLYDSKFDLDVK